MPPNITLPVWATFVVGLAAVLIAARTIIRVARDVAKVIRNLTTLAETTVLIAETFKPNGTDLPATIATIKATGADNNVKLSELWDYTHQFKHDLLGALSGLKLGNDTVDRLVAELADRPRRIDDG